MPFAVDLGASWWPSIQANNLVSLVMSVVLAGVLVQGRVKKLQA